MLLKSWLIFFSLFGLSTLSLSQEKIIFDGKELDFKTEEDYQDYSGKILILINWLKTNSLEHEDRLAAELIFTKWLKETPWPIILYDSYIVDCSKKNPKFMVLFLAGWTNLVLRNPEAHDDKLKCNLAGVNTILDYYLKGESFGVKTDKMLEKLLLKRKEGTLDRYVKRRSSK